MYLQFDYLNIYCYVAIWGGFVHFTKHKLWYQNHPRHPSTMQNSAGAVINNRKTEVRNAIIIMELYLNILDGHLHIWEEQNSWDYTSVVSAPHCTLFIVYSRAYVGTTDTCLHCNTGTTRGNTHNTRTLGWWWWRTQIAFHGHILAIKKSQQLRISGQSKVDTILVRRWETGKQILCNHSIAQVVSCL